MQDKLVWDPSAQEDFSVFARKNDAPALARPDPNSNSKEAESEGKRRRRGDSSDADADDGGENKLAALNDMLKSRRFQIQREDEEDFEAFLHKLNAKRQRDLGPMIDEVRESTSPVKRASPRQGRQTAAQDVRNQYNLTEITEKSGDQDATPSRAISRLDGAEQARREQRAKGRDALEARLTTEDVQDDVQAILSSAMRGRDRPDDESFYSNGLDAMDESSVISNRQRLNDTRPPRRPDDAGSSMGQHLDAGSSNFQPPADHILSEAMKKQHERTKSKANADLADELDIGSSVKINTAIEGFKEFATQSSIESQAVVVPKIDTAQAHATFGRDEDRRASPKTRQRVEEPKPAPLSAKPTTAVVAASDKPQGKTRYEEIMNYLGNIEEEFSHMSITNRSAIADSPGLGTPAGKRGAMLGAGAIMPPSALDESSFLGSQAGEEPQQAYRKIRERLIELEIEKEEQEKQLSMIKQLRQKERTEAHKALDQVKEEGVKQADSVRQELENRIEKQVNMIESLLADKQELSSKVEDLLETVKARDKAIERQRKVVDDRLQVELKKNKEAWTAAEKVRKEKWEKEKIHEIRAQTVKGLEPEIQRIVERNKDEIRRLQDQNAAEQRTKREHVVEEYEQRMHELRTKLVNEKEEAIDKERERAQNKLHEQYERLESQFAEERKRWKDTVFNENSRVEQMLKLENDRLKEEIKQVQTRSANQLSEERKLCEDRVEDMQRRHQYEVKQIKEKLLIEQDELKSELLKKAQDQHIETQRKIREEMVRERNREIEAIIEKLGDETHSTQKTLMAQYESKVAKLEEKHSAEAAEYQTRLQ